MPAALTVAQARRIHDRYQRLMRRIFAAGGTGLEQAQAGLGLQLGQAGDRIARLRGDRPEPSKRVTGVDVAIPRPVAGQRRWFVAMPLYAGSSQRVHLVFQEGAAGWRLVAGSAAPLDHRLPDIALDADGLAAAVGEDAGGLTATPRALAQAHAASLSTFNADPRGRELITPGGYTSEAAVKARAERAQLRGQWKMQIRTRELPDLFSLRTTDGGTLTWYGLREQLVFTVAASGAQRIAFTDQPNVQTLSRGRSFSRHATVTSAGWFLAVIPAAMSRRAPRAEIVGDWWSALSVRGT
ncbi:hypothetical protein ACQPYK_49335 (plasmid) [Streptosporangium sp. CA-135522]|uniref:hypothetical protein n=1 Tax=Streptosporangium sp. CA-135522 TaxID=3240072 RepID=UPI003D8F4A1D